MRGTRKTTICSIQNPVYVVLDNHTPILVEQRKTNKLRESNSFLSVMDTVTACVAEVLSISEKEAKARMAEVVVEGKYLQDVWT